MKKIKILFLIYTLLEINYCTAASQIIKIGSRAEFDSTLSNNDIVVAEFYSPDCPHCRNFERAGIFDSIATAFPDVRCVTVSSDLVDLHADAKITAYPSFIVYKNGKKVGTRIGFQHKEPLKRFIRESTTH